MSLVRETGGTDGTMQSTPKVEQLFDALRWLLTVLQVAGAIIYILKLLGQADNRE
jgi:hypothetical protein